VTRFEPAPDLDARVAREIALPNVERIRDQVRDAARANAPDVRVWLTVRDERVRHTHVETDGQTIPANLRFRLPKVNGVGHDLARHPRDPALPIEQAINCRCEDPAVPGVLAGTIHSHPAVVEGSRVRAEISTDFPRAAESEVGTSEDQAAHFFRNALREVAARLNARSSVR
jgi:hypothetical protein